jgi:hypothetical protein
MIEYSTGRRKLDHGEQGLCHPYAAMNQQRIDRAAADPAPCKFFER